MSTRNILFDSPALHSLKRAQLVKLCKKYNIKASGKNTELVERLKQHAHNLPQDADMTANVFSEQSSDNGDDATMDEYDRSEDTLDRPQRPSEMWEVVMDDIPEEDSNEMQQGTLRSKKSTNTLGVNGEFGLGGSSMSTVTSSLKAFASSLGLKRSASSTSMQNSTNNDTVASQKSSGKGSSSSRKAFLNPARDSLLANAVPYSSIPTSTVLPQTEPFAFSYTTAADTSLVLPPSPSNSSFDRPIPGTAGREGVDVSIVTGTGVEGTIRLITTPYVNSDLSPPKLQPFKPTFDLIPPTPGKCGLSMWPASPGPASALGTGDGKRKSLYPDIGAVLGKTPVKNDSGDEEMSVDVPGGLPPVVPDKSDVGTSLLSPPRPETFIFGSPHPRYSASKKDFSAAAESVLAEMNARLASQGAKTLNSDVLSSNKTAGEKMSQEDMLNYQFGGRKDVDRKAGEGEGSVKWKFDRAHEKEFSKMTGIDQHYAAKRVLPSTTRATQEPLAPLPANRKRKSSALGSGLGNGLPSTSTKQQRRGSNARVISAGTRKKMTLPGAFGDDENDENDEEDDVERRETKRVCAQVGDGDGPGGPVKRVSIAPTNRRTSGSQDGKNSEKEREAIKRMLDYKKAKRRSSMGRPSLVAQQKQKAAPSRFGFLNSAKSIVKAVWNRGAGGSGASAVSSIPVAKPTTRIVSSTNTGSTSNGTATSKPPIPNAKKPSFDTVRSRASANSRAGPASRNVSSSGSGHLNLREASEKTGSVRSVVTPATNNNNTSQSQTRSRSPIPSFNAPGGSIRTSSTNTRNSSIPSTIPASSIGTRRSVSQSTGIGNSTSIGGEDVGSMGLRTRATRPSSTLHAPTLSSLAKVSAKHPASLLPSGSGSTQRLAVAGEASLRGKDGITPSPSKIPIMSPLSPKPRSGAGNTTSGKIFSTPLLLPTSPEAKRAAELGNVINPITGIASPARPPLANSDQNRYDKGHGHDSGGTAGQQKVPSLTRKPRISRSKVIAKLGAQRVASASSTTGAGPSSGVSVLAPRPSGGLSVKAKKGRTRSSYGVAATNRKSIGGKANRASGAGIALSAKKRARQSEYARRRSTRIPVA